jgi:hypothetical protein
MSLYAVLVFGLVLYFKYFINPVLYFTAQEPVFFLDAHFFSEFVTHPGGLLEYGAAFLSQFFFWPWLGAIVIVMLFVLILFTFKTVLATLSVGNTIFFAALPLTVLFFLHHNYTMVLTIDLVVLLALASLVLYSRCNTASAKLIFILLAGPVLYYVAGSAFHIFSLYVIVLEILTSRKVMPMLASVLLAVILPFIAGTFLLVRVKDAFYQPAFPDLRLWSLKLALYLAVPVVLILVVVAKKRMPKPSRLTIILQFVFILALFCAAPILTHNTLSKNFYDIIYCSRTGNWERIVEMGHNPYPNSPQIVSIINRALSHTGHMGDKLFAYPQEFGLRGLFVMDDAHLSSPLIRSDLYFDLGHYNEAKHWAHEAVSVRGETLWNLQRLVVVLLMDGHTEAARVYLNKLKNTITAKKWAAHYLPFATGEKLLRDDPEFAALLKNRVTEKFLTFVNNPVPDLYKLVQANPQNKIATDYLLASLLLTKRVDRFANLLQDFGQGRKVPRHYQEALVLYISQARDAAVNPRVPIEKSVIESFQDFQKSFQANRQNRSAAERALAANYGDTYWFYVLFHQGRDS